MRMVFIMDEVSTVIVDEDTSFALMLAAQARGHQLEHCRVQDVWLDGARVIGLARPATLRRDAAQPVSLGEARELDLAEADVIFIRKDPPFDAPYLWLTLILEHLRGQALIVNDPRGLRDANEKLFTHWFSSVMPRTLVTGNKARITAFINEVGGSAIIKPVDGHGGAGVFALRTGDGNLNALIEASTSGGARVAIVQQLIAEVTQGDKRILLVDGEPIGAILRVPQSGDLRSNIHVGGTVVRAELSERDLEICRLVGPKLRAEGLFFVGIDVIGPFLTEVNVTSPTGIQQMSRLSGEDLEAGVIEALEAKHADAAR